VAPEGAEIHDRLPVISDVPIRGYPAAFVFVVAVFEVVGGFTPLGDVAPTTGLMNWSPRRRNPRRTTTSTSTDLLTMVVAY